MTFYHLECRFADFNFSYALGLAVRPYSIWQDITLHRPFSLTSLMRLAQGVMAAQMTAMLLDDLKVNSCNKLMAYSALRENRKFSFWQRLIFRGK